jgi:hypothetical protein
MSKKKLFPHLPKIEVTRDEAAYMLSIGVDAFDEISDDEIPRIRTGPSERWIRVRVADLEAYREGRARMALPPDLAAPATWLVTPVGPGCASSVYVIRAAGTTAFKIGLATDPLRRLNTLQTASPALLELVLSFPGDRRTEAELHQRFAAERLRGEWFAESPRLLAWIERQRGAGRS